jgi:hypothetical protein
MSDAELMAAVEIIMDREADRVAGEQAAEVRAEIAAGLPQVSELIGRAERVAALRAEKGKGLSARNREVLEWICADLTRLRDMIAAGALE